MPGPKTNIISPPLPSSFSPGRALTLSRCCCSEPTKLPPRLPLQLLSRPGLELLPDTVALGLLRLAAWHTDAATDVDADDMLQALLCLEGQVQGRGGRGGDEGRGARGRRAVKAEGDGPRVRQLLARRCPPMASSCDLKASIFHPQLFLPSCALGPAPLLPHPVWPTSCAAPPPPSPPPPPSCCQVVLCATRCSFPTMANIMWALATLRGPSCTDEAMAAEEGTTAAGPNAIGSIGVARVASRRGAQPLLGACRWPGSDEVLDAIVEWGRWDPDLDPDLDPGTCSTKDLVSMIWGFSALLAQVRSDLDLVVAESGCPLSRHRANASCQCIVPMTANRDLDLNMVRYANGYLNLRLWFMLAQARQAELLATAVTQARQAELLATAVTQARQAELLATTVTQLPSIGTSSSRTDLAPDHYCAPSAGSSNSLRDATGRHQAGSDNAALTASLTSGAAVNLFQDAEKAWEERGKLLDGLCIEMVSR